MLEAGLYSKGATPQLLANSSPAAGRLRFVVTCNQIGAFMALTNSYNRDRNGKYYENILADISILKQGNFENLLLDQNIHEAIKFITHYW